MKKNLLFILCITYVKAFTQNNTITTYQQQYQLNTKQTTTTLKIDGIFDEAAWLTTDTATGFWMKNPRDDAPATTETVIQTCYNETFLYFAIKAYDKMPFIGQSLKRDSRIRDNDGIGIVLDPINKKTNGYYFSVTAYNVQADDVLTAIAEDLSFSYDNKWYSATKQYPTYYTIEIAIPLKTLRYENNTTTWGINFIRSNKKQNEFDTWTKMPVNFRAYDLGYTGALQWLVAPKVAKSNTVLIPYINQSVQTTNAALANITGKFNAGIDAKLAVTQTLNVDLTINPDFSQVEVDKQVTNLSRFSIFFPERRNFFLENSDLYSNYGVDEVKPFYSRTIGLSPTGKALPILGGARLTGNLTPSLRIGVLNMQTKAITDYAAQNYTAITTQKKVLKRSFVKAYLLNRNGIYTSKNKLKKPIDAYGRNTGVQCNYASTTGKYEAYTGLHHAIKPTITNNNNYINYGARYNTRKFTTNINVDHVGTNYYTDMGFVQRIETYYGTTDSVVRNGFTAINNQISYSIFPKHSIVNQHRFSNQLSYILNTNGKFNELNNNFNYTTLFANASLFVVNVGISSVQLQQPTAFTSGLPLPKALYNYNQYSAYYESDTRKNVSYGGGIVTGKFYTANYNKYTAKLIYRKQPYFTAELNAEYNSLQFPMPYTSAKLLLLAQRIEINFSNNLFWTTFIQYNTQRNNINFNSRLQWRYKPVSDLFVVYTDNYFTDPLFKNKNRALVLKLNYWLNM